MAYFYIINPLAGRKKYQKLAEKFRWRLGELGIAGEFAIVTPNDNITKLAQIGVAKNFSTIVAVGGNDTVNAVLPALIGQNKCALGIVPFGETNTFANMMGIADWKEALDALASRRVENVDVGFLGEQPFLTQVYVSPNKNPISAKQPYVQFENQKALSNEAVPSEIEIDERYKIFSRISSISIAKASAGKNIRNSLLDEKLKIRLFSKKEGFSLFTKPDVTKINAEKIHIASTTPLFFSLDGKLVAQTPSSIAIAPKSLRIIVGKETFGRNQKLSVNR